MESDNDYDALVLGLLAIIAGITGVILVMKAVTTEPREAGTFVLGLFTFGVAFIFRMMQLLAE